jgi:indolepyruvate ferredoxin oxidoreductase alpha subunit
MKKKLNGDQALAFGALRSGVKVVSGYPGSPSSGTMEVLIGEAERHGLYAEWSSNEKVALELAIGASIAGRRAVVCTKSVGLNAMIDPLMALNLTPVHGGLVILLGDDPGGYGSQNDQDSRPFASLLEMPMMEPASPSEAFAMMEEAFGISERFHTAVIIRETRSFSQQEEVIRIPQRPLPAKGLGLAREPWRYVPVPSNVVEKHRELHGRIEEMSGLADAFPFNKLTGNGSQGMVAAGFAYRKLLDVLGNKVPQDVRLLKLGLFYPLPRKTVFDLLEGCREVLVFEENEAYLETQIKAAALDAGFSIKVYGKQSGHVSREGELFRWKIQRALNEFMPSFIAPRLYLEEKEAEERPAKRNYCGGCQYDRVFDRLEEAAAGLGQKPLLVGDPGCLVTVADRLDAKYALGSAVAVADGLSKAGIEERSVAIFGDSSFFHTALPAICNAAHNRSDILIVVLDNKAAVSTGFQPNPGADRDAMGRESPALDIGQIARACGIETVFEVGPASLDSALRNTFHKALTRRHLALMIVRLPSS